MVSLMHGLAYLCLATVFLSAQHNPSLQHEHDRLVTGRPDETLPPEAIVLQPLGIAIDSSSQGLIITEVFVEMSAYRAGLCRGDKLMAMDHRPITTRAQALEEMRHLHSAFVMVDVLRGDMRICRRVERSIGPIRQVGTAIAGRVGCLAFQGFSTSTPHEFVQQLQRMLQRSPDTVIIDLRNNPNGNLMAADQVARSLVSAIEQHAQPLRIILVQNHGGTELATALSRKLVQLCSAEIIIPLAAEGSSRSTASVQTNRRWTLSDMQSRPELPGAHAPTGWNMAEFRHRYPEPSTQAMRHPLLLEHPDVAPIAWGINGVAWDGLNIVRAREL